jgi:hypothetical protein
MLPEFRASPGHGVEIAVELLGELDLNGFADFVSDGVVPCEILLVFPRKAAEFIDGGRVIQLKCALHHPSTEEVSRTPQLRVLVMIPVPGPGVLKLVYGGREVSS